MMILVLVALIPPIFLMVQTYRNDKVEREPLSLIGKTILYGAIAVIPILIVELVLEGVFSAVLDDKSMLFKVLDNFLGVAIVEEGFKLMACKKAVWKNKEFNYTFDGIVYAVAASLGFAAVENIMYVFQYGLGTGILRAVTSIPGHTIFGVYMGVYLGLAKYAKYQGSKLQEKRNHILALFVPTVIHGFYDFALSADNSAFVAVFLVFLVGIAIKCMATIKKCGGDNDLAIFAEDNEEDDEDDEE